jgi:hypothetical protein
MARHILFKYKINFRISMVDPRIASGRDRVWKASVILSEIRSRAELNRVCLCFCTPHTNEIPRTDPLVQVDNVRVIDLDIGASKSDIRAVRVVTISERVGTTRVGERPAKREV